MGELQCACVRVCVCVCVCVSGTHAEVPWPWASLQVNETSLQQLTYLPDPTNGQHEIEIAGLQACTHEVSLAHASVLYTRASITHLHLLQAHVRRIQV